MRWQCFALLAGCGGTTSTTIQFRSTLLVQSGTLHFTVQEKGSSTITESYSYSVVTPDGGTPMTALALDPVCNMMTAPLELGFTATGTTFTISGVKGSGDVIVDQYTKQ